MNIEPRESDWPADLKVVVHDGCGKYLAGDAREWYFTTNRAGALVFDLHADRVQEQLDAIRQLHGLVLTPEPVPLEEIYEFCDRCKEFFMPSMVFFDGRRYFCADCRRLVGKSRKKG